MVCGAVGSPSSSPEGEMGSCNLGQLGNGRLGSSRRGKKSSSDKQKQPQRGLGVAQLEKIRLQNEMMAGYLHSPFPSDLNKVVSLPFLSFLKHTHELFCKISMALDLILSPMSSCRRV
ncbi:hypothetical protein B296_00031168 [Ensete ventricosum]|uniref:Uncharacterized protein n=1 Tax=Ensete ventricosum TaxID=4639 RepID=A0A427AH53_ENSVE|nr:hypothetical protein B296_00031168 [Ensete ventricosum]